MSLPARASGSVAIWIGNGWLIPCAVRRSTNLGAIPSSAKVIVISVFGVASIKLASAKFAEM